MEGEPANWVKRTVQIRAMQFSGDAESFNRVVEFTSEAPIYRAQNYDANNHTCQIPTLESAKVAKPGDYIIRGVGGEFYPCPATIFEASRHLVEASFGGNPFIDLWENNPVSILAMYYDGDNFDTIVDYCRANPDATPYGRNERTGNFFIPRGGDKPYTIIPGTVIIHGLDNKFYGIREDIFRNSYEPV